MYKYIYIYTGICVYLYISICFYIDKHGTYLYIDTTYAYMFMYEYVYMYKQPGMLQMTFGIPECICIYILYTCTHI